MIPAHLHAKNISSLLSFSERHRNTWSRPWEILNDRCNCTWHKAMALFTCHFSGPPPSLHVEQGSLNRNCWPCPRKITKGPMEQVGKGMEAQDGKENGKGEGKMTSIPRHPPHNRHYYQFPIGIPNNPPFSVRIFSLHSLVHLSFSSHPKTNFEALNFQHQKKSQDKGHKLTDNA